MPAPGRGGIQLASEGVCPYARGFLQEVCADSSADAAIVTTTCDQMRRMSEIIERESRKPTFLMHVPTTWESVGAQKLYRSELLRLGEFLAGTGGRRPADVTLAKVLAEWDAKRARLRGVQGSLSPRAYSEAIATYGRGGTVVEMGRAPVRRKGVPLALTGGPLMADSMGLFDLAERAGAHIALDATTTGERTLPAAFDRRRLAGDPLGEIAGAYFGSIPDAFRRPNSRLYQWLRDTLAEREIRGIVFLHYVWCDTWRAEGARLKEWADVPVLLLDSDGEYDETRLFSRIQSFVEMLV